VIRDRAVVYEMSYPEPPERVWRALIDPQELAAWLMPNDFLPVVGHRFTMACEPLGRIDAEVIEVDTPRRLVCRWQGSFGDTVVSFELTPEESGTRLRLEHRGWDDASAAYRDQFNSGWPGKLGDGLRAVLSRAAVPAPHL
jgi:uncharacterized protein YndB with AHSA1/START domain